MMRQIFLRARRRFVPVLLTAILLSLVIGKASAQAPSMQAQPPTGAADSMAVMAPSTPPNAAAGAPTKSLPRDLSPWGMFLAADVVVKTVMIGLVFASVVTWTVWLVKSIELAGAKRRLRRAVSLVGSASGLGEAVAVIGKTNDIGAVLVREAAAEVQASAPALGHTDASGLKERISSRLSRAEAEAGRRMMRGTGILATIGATAPFVGLFGTVWGIMNSFIGISQSQTTNLAVVAPGIAEALLATAFGLVAAIPAVIIYNVFARGISGHRQLLGDVSACVEQLVSRDIDFRRISAPLSPAAT